VSESRAKSGDPLLRRLGRGLAALVPARRQNARPEERTAASALDLLVEALQSAMSVAQDRIARRREAELQRRAAEEGAGDSLRVSLDGPGEARTAPTRWPYLVLRPLVMPEITAMSLEFDAAIEEASAGVLPWRRGEPRALTLVIKRRQQEGAPDRALHRIRISLTGPQPGAAEIAVDGVVFKRFAAEPAP
jgi:hypothetical protein